MSGYVDLGPGADRQHAPKIVAQPRAAAAHPAAARPLAGVSLASAVAVVSDASRAWLAVPGFPEMLAAIADVAGRVGPGDTAGISGYRNGAWTVAASDDQALRAERLQESTDDGPRTDTQGPADLTAADLDGDLRWPRWSPAALALGIRSVLSVRLYTDRHLGILNMYSNSRRPYSAEDLAVAQLVGGHASVALARLARDQVRGDVFLPDVLAEDLAQVLSEFAGVLLTDFSIQAILDQLVGRIVAILPIDGAGVTVVSPVISASHIAASDDLALHLERLQVEISDGPNLLAYQLDQSVAAPDLLQDNRFPIFAARAYRAGLRAVFTFPLRHGEHQLGALDLYRKAPGPLSASATAAAKTLADVAAAYLLNAQTRIDLQNSRDRAHQAALHDALTGLPNRILLLDRLEHALRRHRRNAGIVAVLFIDLDWFKAVNDTYGHGTGDELLVAVAQRVSTAIRPGDTLARLSGDEFVIVCESLDTPLQAAAIGTRLLTAVARPFHLSVVTVELTASIGIALTPPGPNTPEKLLHQADLAMYRAKRDGKRRQHLFDLQDGDTGAVR